MTNTGSGFGTVGTNDGGGAPLSESPSDNAVERITEPFYTDADVL